MRRIQGTSGSLAGSGAAPQRHPNSSNTKTNNRREVPAPEPKIERDGPPGAYLRLRRTNRARTLTCGVLEKGQEPYGSKPPSPHKLRSELTFFKQPLARPELIAAAFVRPDAAVPWWHFASPFVLTLHTSPNSRRCQGINATLTSASFLPGDGAPS